VAATFSVLPVSVLPRRGWSLDLLVAVARRRTRESSGQVLDWLAGHGVLIEDRQLRRLQHVVRVVLDRLRTQPVGESLLPAVGPGLPSSQLVEWLGGAEIRGPPWWWVMSFHRLWGQLLWDVRLS
jgi:hypothetical protein